MPSTDMARDPIDGRLGGLVLKDCPTAYRDGAAGTRRDGEYASFKLQADRRASACSEAVQQAVAGLTDGSAERTHAR
jgi:hypothetical protein